MNYRIVKGDSIEQRELLHILDVMFVTEVWIDDYTNLCP
jgi:hypothetical protein